MNTIYKFKIEVHEHSLYGSGMEASKKELVKEYYMVSAKSFTKAFEKAYNHAKKDLDIETLLNDKVDGKSDKVLSISCDVVGETIN